MKKIWVTILIIVAVIVLSIVILNRQDSSVEAELAKCIGENSELYVQLGCHACKAQEEMFGENYQYLNVVDCFYDQDKCIGKIKYTPTWFINGGEYVGVQTIEDLKELTGC